MLFNQRKYHINQDLILSTKVFWHQTIIQFSSIKNNYYHPNHLLGVGGLMLGGRLESVLIFLLGDGLFRVGCLGRRLSGSRLLGDVDIGTSFAWGFAWDGFTWDCEAGVFQNSSTNIFQWQLIPSNQTYSTPSIMHMCWRL